MGRRRKTNFGESAMKNAVSYNQYIERLTELAISMFEWTGLPDSVDERYLELALFTDGCCVFFKDPDMDEYLCLKAMISGTFDVYGIPIRRRAYAYNGYQMDLSNENSVLIYNNMVHTNTTTMVRMYAERLYEIDRIIEVNAKAQKTPVLITATEAQRLTMLNLYKEYDGNSPVIFGDKNLDWSGLKCLKTDAPYMGDKLYQLKTETWNEALTYLGISNMNAQKRERLVTDEAIRSQGGVIASRYSRLNERRKAADKINEMFGLDIAVNYRIDFRQTDDEFMVESDTEDSIVAPMIKDYRTREDYDKFRKVDKEV